MQRTIKNPSMANLKHLAQLEKIAEGWKVCNTSNSEVTSWEALKAWRRWKALKAWRTVNSEVLRWKAWRTANPEIVPDLSGANLRGADLHRMYLIGANLNQADLSRTNLNQANLSGADLSRANLMWTDLSGANLNGATLSGAILFETIFGNTSLNDVQGLDACVHQGPSTIDYRTMAISGSLPLVFLRGCGLPDEFIDYLPSLLSQPIQFYSCFISYSTKDKLFVERLHADLQNKNVRCWFAPHDLPIGAKTLDAIYEAIRIRDKVLLVLSQGAIDSDWVEDEVSKAFAKERTRETTVLFPIRIDDSVMTTNEAWACKLRDMRNIGDFLKWNEPSEYNKSLERVLRDLKNTE